VIIYGIPEAEGNLKHQLDKHDKDFLSNLCKEINAEDAMPAEIRRLGWKEEEKQEQFAFSGVDLKTKICS
jgi:hypothetical protein